MFGRRNKIVEPDFGTKTKPEYPKEILESGKLRGYFYGETIPKMSTEYIKHVWKENIHRNKTILIRMFLRKGGMAEFLIATNKPIFEYMGGAYVIDSDLLRRDSTSGYMYLIYTQGVSIPLNVNIIDSDIIKAIQKKTEFDDIVENVNPQTLKAVINSNTIQKVMAGGELEGTFQMLLYFAIGNALGTFFLLLMIGYTQLRR